MEIKLLTGDEVVEKIQVSSAEAYILMKKAEIQTVRFGRSVHVIYIDLDNYVNRNL